MATGGKEVSGNSAPATQQRVWASIAQGLRKAAALPVGASRIYVCASRQLKSKSLGQTLKLFLKTTEKQRSPHPPCCCLFSLSVIIDCVPKKLSHSLSSVYIQVKFQSYTPSHRGSLGVSVSGPQYCKVSVSTSRYLRRHLCL